MTENFLSTILSEKQREIVIRKAAMPVEKLKNSAAEKPRDFAGAIGKNGFNIIAEIKKASPSRGLIRPDFEPLSIARTFELGGAAALSVLTDEKFFQGSLSILQQISRQSNIPVLRKDFILDPYQIYEARFFGADALLLIAAAMEKRQLSELLHLTESLGMSALVEVHDDLDTKKALSIGAKIIGINNRDLKTFKTDLETTFRLRKFIAEEEHIIIAESGIETREHIRRLYSEGINAALIGEALMREADIGRKLREFIL